MIRYIRECIAYLLMFAMITTTFQPLCAKPVVVQHDVLELSHLPRQLKAEEALQKEFCSPSPTNSKELLRGIKNNELFIFGSLNPHSNKQVEPVPVVEDEDEFFDAVEFDDDDIFVDAEEPAMDSQIREVPELDSYSEDEDEDEEVGTLYPTQVIDEDEEQASTAQTMWDSLVWIAKGTGWFAKGTVQVVYECVKYVKNNPAKAVVIGLLAFSPGAMASNEFRINQNSPFAGSTPYSTFLSPNTAGIVWVGANSMGGASGFSLRFFSVDGNPITDEILSQVTSNQAFDLAPPLAISPDETFQVYTGATDLISGRGYFLSNGTASTPIRTIDTGGRGFSPDTTLDPSGQQHGVTWYDPDINDVYGQFINDAGVTQLGVEVLLFSNCTNPSLARLPNGLFAVVAENLDGSLRARTFNETFAPQSPEEEISTSGTLPSVASFDDSSTVYTYQQGDDIIAQTRNPDLTARTSETQVSQPNSTSNTNPQVEILPDTLFSTFPQETTFFVWECAGEICALLATLGLGALSNVFLVNQNTTGLQTRPAVSVDPATGTVLVTWQDALRNTWGRFLDGNFLRALVGEFPSSTSMSSTTATSTTATSITATSTETFDVSSGSSAANIIGPVVGGVLGGVVLCCCLVIAGVTVFILVKRRGESNHPSQLELDFPEQPSSAFGSANPSVFEPKESGYGSEHLTFEGSITGHKYKLLDQVSASEAQDFQPFVAKHIEPATEEEQRVFERQQKKKQQLKPPSFDFSLGNGFFGTIYLGYNEKTDQKVAIKVVTGEVGIRESLLEGQCMDAVRGHPNVMELLDYSHNKPTIGNETLNQVTPLMYCNGDHLREMFLILEPNKRVQWVGDFFAQLMAGLSHIHKILGGHWDIKRDNLLFTLEGCLKIGDFGKAKEKNVKVRDLSQLGDKRKFGPEATALLRKLAETPEVPLAGEKVDSVSGPEMDVYACGLCVGELFDWELFSFRLIPSLARVKSWTYRQYGLAVEESLKLIPNKAPFLPTLRETLVSDPEKRITSDQAYQQLASLEWSSNHREAAFSQLIKDYAFAMRQRETQQVPKAQLQMPKEEPPKYTRDELYEKAKVINLSVSEGTDSQAPSGWYPALED